MTDILDIEKIKALLDEFASARDWNKFHTPKNLAMALAAESGELLEIFQWLSETETYKAHTDVDIKQKTSHELADIMLYAIRLAAAMNINLSQAIQEKILLNGKKYPANKKYTELDLRK